MMVPTKRSHLDFAVLLLLLPGAPAASQAGQVEDFRWSGTRVVIDARADSGVRVTMSRDSVADAAWFTPELVTRWCDSMSEKLAKPPLKSEHNAWYRLSEPLPSSNGHAPLSVLSSLLSGEDLYRIGFDDGKTLDKLPADVTEVQLEDFVAAMRETADRAARLAGTAPARVYMPYQVTRPVVVKPGNPVPRYPPALSGTSKTGTVRVQFVVDSTGNAIMSTFQVILTNDMKFADEVERILPMMRFEPAEVDGRPVRQVVRMAFTFTEQH